jgi:outer membrane immunogenic protein
MKRIVAAASVALFGVGSGAFAADMPLKALPPPVALYTWTGCYVGGNGGGLWAHKRWVDDDQLSTAFGQTRFDHTTSGGMGGGQVGCDYQMGRWVFGIEGSYDGANSKATSLDQVFTNISGTTDVTGLGTVTGRAGYTVLDGNRGLVYLRGGAAFERDRYSTTNLRTNLTELTAGENRTGALIGVGFEYFFIKNLSGFIEFDYIDMGTRDVNFYSTTTNFTTTLKIRERKDVVKVGLNWLFDMGGPVIAKY